ncbi:MAG: amidohydrolase [Clostridia bacterium]|nr:amidohydrolase [Clostridia bacterium]
MKKIFDIHTHVYPPKIADKATYNLGRFYDFPVEGEGKIDDLEKSREFGVCGFLLLGVATNPTQVESVNTFLAETAKESRERGFETYAFMGMHQDHPDFAAELDRALSLGLKGIKIHPDIQGVDIDDRRLFELYSLIEGKLPIYFHMGDDREEYRFSTADKLAHVLSEFPKLTVGAAHFGGYKAWEDSFRVLRGRENVWFDTSSSLWAMDLETANKALSVLGTERLMFGTDYPVKTAGQEIPLFDRLNLSDGQREDVLWSNAIRFINN